jgi:hypothetical protein
LFCIADKIKVSVLSFMVPVPAVINLFISEINKPITGIAWLSGQG